MLILAHDRRKIVRFDVTQHPTAGWLSRQVTEAFPWDSAPRFLLRDRDRHTAWSSASASTQWASRKSSLLRSHRGRILMSRGSSARSVGSVWTTSSSSTNAICAASFLLTRTTTTEPEHIYRWKKGVPSLACPPAHTWESDRHSAGWWSAPSLRTPRRLTRLDKLSCRKGRRCGSFSRSIGTLNPWPRRSPSGHCHINSSGLRLRAHRHDRLPEIRFLAATGHFAA